MIRLVEVFCATQRHQKTKNKKNESQTKVRMAYTSLILLSIIVPSRPPGIGVWVNSTVKCTLGYYNFYNYHRQVQTNPQSYRNINTIFFS